MSKLKTTIAFLMGVVIGGGAVWYLTKEKYAQIAEDEISSVKEAYARREQQKKDTQGTDISPDEGVVQVPATTGKVQDKGDIKEFARRVEGDGRYTNYSTTSVPGKPAGIPEEVDKAMQRYQGLGDGETVRVPYVISPEDFNELEGFTPVSLTYFADEVLADERGVVVEDPEELIGDGLQHFGEYEEDSVFVRNELLKCDYEILRDLGTYEEFRKTLPKNI